MKIFNLLAVPLFMFTYFHSDCQDQSPDFGLLSPKAAAALQSGASVAQLLGLKFRDFKLQGKVNTELQDLTQEIKKSLLNSEDGYLVRVQLYTDSNGTPFVPGGQLLLPIGAAKEPVVALAEFVRQPQITAAPPAGLQNSSYYLWMRKDASGTLTARTILRELTPQLERQARAEARRRELSRVTGNTEKERAQAIDRAAYWSTVANAQLDKIKSEASRKRIETLTAQFTAAQAEFNNAYEGYQRISREIAAQQERISALNRIATLSSIVESGIKAHELVCGTKTANLASKAPTDPQVVINYSRETINKLTGYRDKESITIYREKAKDVQRLDTELEQEYKKEGIPSSPPLVVPQP